jgi:hypothetical protein
MKNTDIRPFFVSIPWIFPVTSHGPEVRKRGVSLLAELKSAI